MHDGEPNDTSNYDIGCLSSISLTECENKCKETSNCYWFIYKKYNEFCCRKKYSSNFSNWKWLTTSKTFTICDTSMDRFTSKITENIIAYSGTTSVELYSSNTDMFTAPTGTHCASWTCKLY